VERIEFGAGLVGNLHVPDVADDSSLPAVVLTGTVTAVKEQSGDYARALADRGIVALAFDHYGWGESEGLDRQHEDPGRKVDDLHDAVTFLRQLDLVDPARVHLAGACLGAAYAIAAAASDPRVAGVVAIAGCFSSPALMRRTLGEDAYRKSLQRLVETVAATSGKARMTAFSMSEEAFMPFPAMCGYFATARSRTVNWVNEITVRSAWNLMTHDFVAPAAHLGSTPLLIVHGLDDELCVPAAARQAYALATGPRDVVWLKARHADFLAAGPTLDAAVACVVQFGGADLVPLTSQGGEPPIPGASEPSGLRSVG